MKVVTGNGGGLTGLTAAAMATVKAHMILACVSLPFLWVLLRVNVWKRLAGATVVGVMCLLPWTWMNFRDSGRFIPFSAIAGTVFFDCTNPYAQGKPTNRFQLPAAEEAGHTEIELNSMRMRRALEYIRSDPNRYLRLLGKKLIYAFSPARDYMFESEGQTRLFTPFLSRWGPIVLQLRATSRSRVRPCRTVAHPACVRSVPGPVVVVDIDPVDLLCISALQVPLSVRAAAHRGVGMDLGNRSGMGKERTTSPSPTGLDEQQKSMDQDFLVWAPKAHGDATKPRLTKISADSPSSR